MRYAARRDRVPVARPDLIARGIELMSDPATLNHCSEMARERMNDFRIEAIAAHFWALFDEVAALDSISSMRGAGASLLFRCGRCPRAREGARLTRVALGDPVSIAFGNDAGA